MGFEQQPLSPLLIANVARNANSIGFVGNFRRRGLAGVPLTIAGPSQHVSTAKPVRQNGGISRVPTEIYEEYSRARPISGLLDAYIMVL